jgi:hypothetical protein
VSQLYNNNNNNSNNNNNNSQQEPPDNNVIELLFNLVLIRTTQVPAVSNKT